MTRKLEIMIEILMTKNSEINFMLVININQFYFKRKSQNRISQQFYICA